MCADGNLSPHETEQLLHPTEMQSGFSGAKVPSTLNSDPGRDGTFISKPTRSIPCGKAFPLLDTGTSIDQRRGCEASSMGVLVCWYDEDTCRIPQSFLQYLNY